MLPSRRHWPQTLRTAPQRICGSCTRTRWTRKNFTMRLMLMPARKLRSLSGILHQKRAVTKKEQDDLKEIEEASKTSWFVDTSVLDTASETVATRPEQVFTPTGIQFDFKDGCSVSTCRTNKGTPTTHATPSTRATSQYTRSDATVTSEVTMESRMDTLETNQAEVQDMLREILTTIKPSGDRQNGPGAVTPHDRASKKPASPNGEVGI